MLDLKKTRDLVCWKLICWQWEEVGAFGYHRRNELTFRKDKRGKVLHIVSDISVSADNLGLYEIQRLFKFYTIIAPPQDVFQPSRIQWI